MSRYTAVRLKGVFQTRLAVSRLYSSKEFRSLLPTSATVSPFADPSRTRVTPLAPQLLKAEQTNSQAINIEPQTKEQGRTFEEVTAATHSQSEDPKATYSVAEETKAQESKPERSAVQDLLELEKSLKSLAESAPKESSSSSGSATPIDEDEEAAKAREKRKQRIERSTMIGGYVLIGMTVAGGIGFCLYNGRAKRDDAGNIIPDQYTGSLMAPFYRIYDSIWFWRDFVVEPSRDKLLPDPLPAPYIQPKYTLVIELKNILVHPDWTYKTGYRFLKRPALDYFLDVVGYPNFELVIYTGESAMTAIPVTESIDPKHRIMYKLYKDCTKYKKGQHYKDLSKLNRDLSKVIYVEFDAKSGQLNPENMLCVPEWKGNMDDTTLVDLAELLKTIHLSDTDDVRPMLQYYSQFDDPAKEFRRRAIYLAEQEQQQLSQPQQQSFLTRYTGKLFGLNRHNQA